VNEKIFTVPAELTAAPPAHRPPLSEVEHLRVSERTAFGIATIAVMAYNVVPIVLIGGWVPSPMQTAAATTDHPDVMLWLITISMLFALPFLVMQVFAPACRWRQCLTRWSTYAHLASGCAWAAMAIMSRGVDFGLYGIVLWLGVLINLAFAFTVALSVNHEQLRTIDARKCPQ
jgi:hypothetical protein